MSNEIAVSFKYKTFMPTFISLVIFFFKQKLNQEIFTMKDNYAPAYNKSF